MKRAYFIPGGRPIVETYQQEIVGTCHCGQPVIKVIGSSFPWSPDKIRYRYPGINTCGSITWCRVCWGYVPQTWRPKLVFCTDF